MECINKLYRIPFTWTAAHRAVPSCVRGATTTMGGLLCAPVAAQALYSQTTIPVSTVKPLCNAGCFMFIGSFQLYGPTSVVSVEHTLSHEMDGSPRCSGVLNSALFHLTFTYHIQTDHVVFPARCNEPNWSAKSGWFCGQDTIGWVNV